MGRALKLAVVLTALALLSPVAVYVMVAVSETARATFNSTASYAPGLAFFSPFGVAAYVLMLDFFASPVKSMAELLSKIIYERRGGTGGYRGVARWKPRIATAASGRAGGALRIEAPAVPTWSAAGMTPAPAAEKPATVSTRKPEAEMKVHCPRTPPRMPEPAATERQALSISRHPRLPEEQ